MADSIVAAVLKSTIAWLSEKGRVRPLEDLNLQADVFDQQFCNSLVRELEEAKIAASDDNLKETIEFYRNGVAKISFAETRESENGVICRAIVGSDAKEKFRRAREKATSTFNNTSLVTTDRILAMYFCVKATLLEQVDSPMEALVSCTTHLEELHSMKAVRNSFSLELNKGPLYFSSEDNTAQVVSSVRRVNCIVFDVTQVVGTDRQLVIWPSVAIEKEKIDPLHELRLGKTLCQQEQNKDSAVEKSFGEDNLSLPSGIATNSEGQFIVADSTKIKVFDRSGKYLYPISLPIDDKYLYDIVDVDTDRENNAYLLVSMANDDGDDKPKLKEHWYQVFVFDKHGNQRRERTFNLKDNSKGRKLAVSSYGEETKVLVLEGRRDLHAIVEVYETDGTFVCHFGDRVLMDGQDIVAANNGHVYVLDQFHDDRGKCVHEFSAERKLVRSFGVDPDSLAITFDQRSENIVIVSSLYDPEKVGYHQNVTLYDSKNTRSDDSYIDSKLVRTYEVGAVRVLLDLSITVSLSGLIAVVLAQDFNGELQGKVVVVKDT